MTDKEYEQKKRECWLECTLGDLADRIDNIQDIRGIDICKEVFDLAFSQGYALGKQEKDTEKSKRICLRDKSKACNKCHECDIETDEYYSMSR